jgi:hypothetical protein
VYFTGSNKKILCRLFIKANTLITSNKSVEYFTPCKYIPNGKNLSALVPKKTRVTQLWKNTNSHNKEDTVIIFKRITEYFLCAINLALDYRYLKRK